MMPAIAALMRRLMSLETKTTEALGSFSFSARMDPRMWLSGITAPKRLPASKLPVWKSRRPALSGPAQLQPLRAAPADAVVDMRHALRLDELVEEAADLARVAARFGRAFLRVVQLFHHLHRQVDVVFFELEQRRRVVHQHIGIEDVDPLAARHAVSLRRDCKVSSTASAWPGTFTPRHSRATWASGPSRNVLRSTPMYLRPYNCFSR
jgi:hypothetical protein